MRGTMVGKAIISILLFLCALLVGTMFGIWFGYNPANISGPAYVEVQQHAITALNTPMPVLGTICIVLCVGAAVMHRETPVQARMFIGASLLLIGAGLITRFGNQPINAVVMTFDPQHLPAEWSALRDQWWQWHVLRTAMALVAFVLLIIAGQITDRRIHAQSAATSI